ncbi:unnamed protein product [Diatraea saccharalis]|uniref:Ribosomal RNA-processing protein 14/surfeit locus protein 6 C-terminal domain-containing protein n=1 Tax=Diatraea saccharalis TaxID=40085 RepID=A0A9N9QTR8_9NEOP|nr:unnamed protein product [Diatraea saccharalis]
MSDTKKFLKFKPIKKEIAKELGFIKNILSCMNLPLQSKGENDDIYYEITNDTKSEIKDLPKRARNITELEEKLQKLKSQHNYNLKNKLVKKSLTSKLNKKIKKKERLNKNRVKPIVDGPFMDAGKTVKEEKPNVNIAKPVFNVDGKLVFSKFDFANVGKTVKKVEKDPKKILPNLQEQEKKIRELEEKGDDSAKKLKEKIAWKSVLQKAEGLKVKDDPNLLKKSIKKIEQKKKQSKKKWENRIQSVQQKKEDRQKKRKENISKKKKEKKSKVVKAAVKRGRVVI